MKRFNWYVVFGIVLILLSIVLYVLHFIVFHDSHHIFIYFFGDLAFVPIEVFLVTLIIHRMLSMREKRFMMEKLNMVIGIFFTEAGTELLKHFFVFTTNFDDLSSQFTGIADWKNKDFVMYQQKKKTLTYGIDISRGNLEELRDFLSLKRDFLLRLLENPNLLQHDAFTDLLWAVTHLIEELQSRKNFETLPETDLNHLEGDMLRAYRYLIQEWLDYMFHLKTAYPYLFSLAARMNPFNPDASPEIT